MWGHVVSQNGPMKWKYDTVSLLSVCIRESSSLSHFGSKASTEQILSMCSRVIRALFVDKVTIDKDSPIHHFLITPS